MPRPKKSVAPQRHYFMKFVFSDWTSDGPLGACSAGARGMWIEMLCQMGVSQERGYLLMHGAVPTVAQIAGMTRIPVAEATGYLAELEAARIFSRDERGAIYCRRMVREVEEEEARKRDGVPHYDPPGTTVYLYVLAHPAGHSRVGITRNLSARKKRHKEVVPEATMVRALALPSRKVALKAERLVQERLRNSGAQELPREWFAAPWETAWELAQKVTGIRESV